MRSRLLAATVAALLAATPAFAESDRPKPRPRCGLSDSPNDVPSGAFDIVCADLAVGGKTVIGVLYIRNLEDEPLYESVAGATWTLTFAVGKTEYTFRRRRSAGAEGRYTYDFGKAPVVVTETATRIMWTVQRSHVPGLGRGKPRLVSATTSGLVSKDEAVR